MNADLIIVISDGEIVEQGTHDELLLSRGKYYNLWSKQVLVGTSAEEPKDPEDPQNTPAIINDLGHVGNHAPAEEANPASAPSQSMLEIGEAPLKGIASKAAVAAEGVLKSEAPDFIPKYFHDFAQPSDDTVDDKGAAAEDSSAEKSDRQKREKEAKKQEKAEQKTENRAQKQTYPKEVKSQGSVDGAERLAEGKIAMVDSSQQHLKEPPDVFGKHEKEKRRRYRYRSLRLRSRKDRNSEAAGNQATEEMDGQMTPALATPLENEAGLDGLKEKNSRPRSRRAKSKSTPEAQVDGADDSNSNHMPAFAGNRSVIYQQRRASAPSDPPDGPKDISQGQRRRRPRRWRNRSKAEAKSTDATTSSSTETSSTQPPPTPSATPSGEAFSGY
jgi:hypothetical protein